MNRLTGFITRLRRTFHRRRFEFEMAEEMRLHIEEETARRIATGEDPVTAHRRAAATFGSRDARTEEVRDGRLGIWFEQAWQDLGYAMRQLRQSPEFSAVAISILAIGIAANTSIFSALDSTLLRPLPYKNPEQLVQVSETTEGGRRNGVSGGAFQDWRDNPTQIEAIALTNSITGNLRSGATVERINGMEATHGLLDVLGISPLRGRGFTAQDEQVGGNQRVIILTEEFWRSRFGADETLLGRNIQLNDEPHEVIGILPANAWFFHHPKYFLPAVLDPNISGRSSRSSHWADVYARMKPGVTVDQLDAELKALKVSLNPEYPVYKRVWNVRVMPLQSVLASNPRPVLLTLICVVALVLAIACANVANLLLARASRRRREISLRAALGASGQRLVRQVLTESLLLAALGGAAGILLSWWGVQAVGALSTNLLPQVMAPQLNLRVLLVSLSLTAATGVLFGLIPAWHARRSELNDALKSGSHGASGLRRTQAQSTLVVAELAFTLLLLVGAGLLLRSLINTARVDPGFNVENVLTFDLSPPENRYDTRESNLAYLNEVQQELSNIPGIEAVGTTIESPFLGGALREIVRRADRPRPEVNFTGRINLLGGDYYTAMGMRLLRGRTQTTAEFSADSAPVVVVNQRLVNQFFPDEDPLGKQLWVSGGLGILEIIGVVADVRPLRLDQAPLPYVYASQSFQPFGISVVVRTHDLEPLSLVPSVRAALERIDPGIPMANTRSLTQALDYSLAQRRLVLRLVGGFAITALILACIGLYGVMSYTVATRSRELAIRLALGASRQSIVGLVMNDGGRLALIGLGVGLAVTFATSRLIAAQLFETPPHDPIVIATAAVTLGTVALLACWFPARRAARADPIQALRNE